MILNELVQRRIAMMAAAVVAGLLGGAILPAAASAHFDSGLYSHKLNDCASRVDPIGTVFFDNGTIGNAQTHIWQDAGWGGTVIEDKQYFASHGVCRLQDGANADGWVENDRNHIRLKQTAESDPTLGVTTVGTPHEERRDCSGGIGSHRVTPNGFANGREALLDFMWMDHPGYYYSYWGNTQPMSQCDEFVATGDGVVAYIPIDSSAIAQGGAAIAQGGAAQDSSNTISVPSTDGAAPLIVTPRGNLTLAQARAFDQFSAYFVGTSFETHPLEATIRLKAARGRLTQPVRANYLQFLYGSCEIPMRPDGTYQRGCTPPLAVQVWPACERHTGLYAFGPDETLTVRGAAAAFYEDHRRLEVFTGTSTVVLFGGGRADLLRAAAQLRSVDTGVDADDRLPAQVPNAQSDTTPCQ